jgi:FkbM family methyltransferase
VNVEVYWSHSFLPSLVRRDGIVFDFGVNDGGFSRLMAPKCRVVVGFEPDPAWQGRHELPANVRVTPKALAARAGTIAFHVNQDLCSSMHYAEPNAREVRVEALTLEAALASEPDGRIDLLKMDIEGEEVDVLLNAPEAAFSRVVQMTVEFHDFLDPSSTPAIREAIRRMRGFGFHSVRFSFRSYGDVLFINRRLAPLNVWQRLWLRLRFKYLRGLRRAAFRLLPSS